ncbi:MAG TPA: PRC-barrel domain-containing protein [Gemmatimonadales bacterium]|nr:PRC-barrel domain-containing protein [Gemmatimonadales bacterium]
MRRTEQKSTTSRERTATLYRLEARDLQLADPNADIRGKNVRDLAGEEIGKVHDLLIDEEERKVRFIEVASGGVLGIGDTKFLLPVEAATAVLADEIRINQDRTQVVGSPRYDPNLIEQPDLNELYRYYGYGTPFWGRGYVYPRYPY